MCASAGIPILPDDPPDSDGGGENIDVSENMDVSEYGSGSERAYQDLLDDHEKGAPRFPENDLWPLSTGGLPLRERFLQLLCESNEVEQYYNVMDHWTSRGDSESDVDMREVVKGLPAMSERKRVFELFKRDDETASDRSRPATEEVRSHRRCDGRRGFGAISVGGHSGSV